MDESNSKCANAEVLRHILCTGQNVTFGTAKKERSYQFKVLERLDFERENPDFDVIRREFGL